MTIHSSTKQIFRPIWTCGKYHETGKVAIYYNLLDGVSYLFEDYSALVVSFLLALPRNGSTTVEKIAQETGIAIESLSPFIQELIDLQLIANHKPTNDEIENYRKSIADKRIKDVQSLVKTTKEKLPLAISNAEMDYTEKAGGITSVMLELTYNCSEKCIHCYNIGATRNDDEVSYRSNLQELSLGDYRRIIDELIEQGLTKVCLSGGDPFSKPDSWEIIDYLYQKGIATDIYTNGQRLINDVERLANYFPRTVEISIYSGDADTHDAITRINGSWQKSISVIEQLSLLGVPTVIKCCVMRQNVKNYYTVGDLGRKYGVPVQYELNITDSIEGDKCASQYIRLTPEMMDIVLQDDNTPMYVGKEVPNFGGQPRLMTINACGAGYNTFCITPDGDLIPCCAFHQSFGNLKNSHINEILRSESLSEWQMLTLDQYEDCGKHDYCDYCNLCAGNNYSEHGDATKAGENNCYMAKCRFKLAHRLMNGERPLNPTEIKERLQHITTTDSQQIMRVFSFDNEGRTNKS